MVNKDSLSHESRERQQKKIEKNKRGKIYDDLQVQGTNNSSIVSKRSVEILYNKHLEPESKEWFGYFVPKSKRRSPAINRGYWLRMEATKRNLESIIANNEGRPVQIVNLGCGYDPIPFQLLSKYGENSNVRLKFYDIDYPELVEKKRKMILSSSDLTRIIGHDKAEEKAIDKDVVLSTDNYVLIGCDLKKGESYKAFTERYLMSKFSITVFIAEVSLAYMKPEFSNPVIEHSSMVPNSHFIILEQVIPSGKNHSFAQRMIYHFDHLRSPIYCVQEYPTSQDQYKRFSKYFTSVEVRNLYESWQSLIPYETRRKVSDIENFDEWEEFLVFCHHYVIVHATSTDQLLFKEKKEALSDIETINSSVSVSHMNVFSDQALTLKFPAAARCKDKVFLYGGLNQARSDDLISLSKGETSIESTQGDKPGPSMCQTLTEINEKLFLIGGRTRPSMPLNQVYMFEKGIWTKRSEMPSGRSRHAVVKVDEKNLLIFGGLEEDQNEALFLLYDTENDSYSNVHVEGHIENIKSCSMIFNGRFGLILGGIVDLHTPTLNSTLYKFVLENHTINVSRVTDHHHFARIGCKAHFMNDSEILVVGGTPSNYLPDQSNSIFTYCLKYSQFKAVPIPDPIWTQNPPVFVGFELVSLGPSKLMVVGGGAVCYSFGSGYNPIMVLTY